MKILAKSIYRTKLNGAGGNLKGDILKKLVWVLRMKDKLGIGAIKR